MSLNQKKILMIGYGGGHIPILNKIAQEFIANNEVELVILPLNGAIPFIMERYPAKNICTLASFAYLFDGDIDVILNYGKMLLAENYNPNIGITKLESMFYLGLSYFDLVSEVGSEKEAAKIYNERKRQAFFPVSTLCKIFESIAPDLIITTTSPRFEAAALEAGRKLNIKSLQLIDLFGDDYPLPTADHIVVMNEQVKQKLIKRGNTTSTYHILGQPILEETIDKVKSIDQATIKKQFNLPEKSLMLYGPIRNYIVNEDFTIKEERDASKINQTIFDILDEVAEKFNIHILVRPHPSDHIDTYRKYTDGKSHYSYCPELNIYEAIAAADYLLSYCSTIVIQSVICNKRSFTFNQNPEVNYNWKELASDPFIYAANFEELKINLHKYLPSNAPIAVGNFFETGSIEKIKTLINQIIC